MVVNMNGELNDDELLAALRAEFLKAFDFIKDDAELRKRLLATNQWWAEEWCQTSADRGALANTYARAKLADYKEPKTTDVAWPRRAFAKLDVGAVAKNLITGEPQFSDAQIARRRLQDGAEYGEVIAKIKNNLDYRAVASHVLPEDWKLDEDSKKRYLEGRRLVHEKADQIHPDELPHAGPHISVYFKEIKTLAHVFAHLVKAFGPIVQTIQSDKSAYAPACRVFGKPNVDRVLKLQPVEAARALAICKFNRSMNREYAESLVADISRELTAATYVRAKKIASAQTLAKRSKQQFEDDRAELTAFVNASMAKNKRRLVLGERQTEILMRILSTKVHSLAKPA